MLVKTTAPVNEPPARETLVPAPARETFVPAPAWRTKLWHAMRLKEKFSLTDLARVVLDDNNAHADPLSAIRRYVSALAATGYLVELPRRNGRKRYLLVRNTGRIAPEPRSNGDLFDPNSNQTFERPSKQQEACDGLA